MDPLAARLSARIAIRAAWLAVGLGVILSLALACAVQTARLEGFHVWPVSVTGWKATAARNATERDAARRAHADTKAAYRLAQQLAEAADTRRNAAVAAKQKDITDAIASDFAARLAGVRARADRLRRDLEPRHAAGGAPAGLAMPGVPAAAGRPDGAAEDSGLPAAVLAIADRLERDLVATEQAEQLSALIAWIEAQAAIDPNADVAAQAAVQQMLLLPGNGAAPSDEVKD